MFHSIYLHQDDIIIVAKSISIVVVFIQLIVQTTICAIKHDTLQVSYYIIIIQNDIKRYIIINRHKKKEKKKKKILRVKLILSNNQLI